MRWRARGNLGGGRDGEVTAVSKIRRRLAVEEYLKPQHRFAHLFADPPRRDVLDAIQAIADRNVRRFGLVEETEEA